MSTPKLDPAQLRLAAEIIEKNLEWEYEYRYGPDSTWLTPSLTKLEEAICNHHRVRIKPLDRWAKEKAAREDGKVIQYRPEGSNGEWESDEDPIWTNLCEYRIKPWSLSDPPAGRQWLRAADWKEEDLPEGWMPCFDGEVPEHGDEFKDGHSCWKPWPGDKVELSYIFYPHRTRRPRLPFEPVYVPLSREDIPPGSYVYPDGKPLEWQMVSRAELAVVRFGIYGALSYETLMSQNWQIVRPGQQATPCRKEKG